MLLRVANPCVTQTFSQVKITSGWKNTDHQIIMLVLDHISLADVIFDEIIIIWKEHVEQETQYQHDHIINSH